MNKIKEFDRQNLKPLRQDIDKALKAVAEKYGLSLMLGNIRFNESSATCKLEARVTEKTGEPTMAADFRALAPTYGLESSLLYQTVLMDGKFYKIVGLKPRNRKYPIIATRVDTGKRYKFPASVVRMAARSV